MSIPFTDIDQQASQLKKALSVLALVTDNLPSNSDNEECAWAIAASFDVVHQVITRLEELVAGEIAHMSAHNEQARAERSDS